MTERRDFKRVVRKRAAKTGESYQAARRRVEGQPARLSARVGAMWAHPDGLVLGCTVEEGKLARGMSVWVMAGDTVLHKGTVASLRRGKQDRDVVAAGQCGILLDPPFHGHIAVEGAEFAAALRPVVMRPMPDRVVDGE